MDEPFPESVQPGMMRTLELLAASAEDQIRFFPPFVSVTDELVIDFDHWSKAFLRNYREELTVDQVASINAIHDRIRAMDKKTKLWSDKALRLSPEWDAIRTLAADALVALGWMAKQPKRKPN